MAIDFAALFDPPPRRRQAPAAGVVSTGVQAPVVPGNGSPSARLGQRQEDQAAGQAIQEDRLDGPSAEPAYPAPSPGGLPLSASVEAQLPPVVEGQSEPAPAAPTHGVAFHPVWLSIPITSRIYAFDRRDRLCYGLNCHLWTFERSPVWYYQAETPLPPLRRQGEAYYVDTQAVLRLVQTYHTRKE